MVRHRRSPKTRTCSKYVNAARRDDVYHDDKHKRETMEIERKSLNIIIVRVTHSSKIINKSQRVVLSTRYSRMDFRRKCEL